MKKWLYTLLGLVMGIALTISLTAAAEDIKGMIGKQVDDQSVVIVDGKELQVPVIIIEGTSYGPIRAIGEAINRKVDWKEGKVILETKSLDEMRYEVKTGLDKVNLTIELQNQYNDLMKEYQPIVQKINAFELDKEDSGVTKEEYISLRVKHDELMGKMKAITDEMVTLSKPNE